jgi:threonyl-tRNA synthetase
VSQIKIQVLDRQAQRSEREVTTGTTAGDLYAGDRDVVVARVNGQLRDLARALADGDEVEPVTADSPEGRAVIRHSTAHVMAQAVQQAFPEAKLGIGPPVENGFYYDFQVDRAFTPEDLKSVESRMRDIVKQGQRFVRREVTDADARAELADEPFKLELIGIKGNTGSDDEASTDVGAGVLTIYDNVDAKTGELRWKDLCRGPHVPSTRPSAAITASSARSSTCSPSPRR